MSTVGDLLVPHRRRLWLYAVGGLVILFLLVPTLIVIPMSFSGTDFLSFPPTDWSDRWYEAYFSSIEWRSATWVSLKTALLTVLVATPIGTAAAYGLHVSRSRFATLILVLLAMPMMVPVILIAIGAFYLYARVGLLHTITALVLAHTTLAIPFVVAVVSAGLKSYDMNQERAAQSLGASRLRSFLGVTLPQIRFSIFSGALLAFLTSFDEVIVGLLVSGGDNATLTRKMFTALRDHIDPTIAAISTLLISISVGIVLLVQALTARGPAR